MSAADFCSQGQRQYSCQQHRRPYFGRKHDSFRASEDAVDSQRQHAALVSAFIGSLSAQPVHADKILSRAKPHYARGRINCALEP